MPSGFYKTTGKPIGLGRKLSDIAKTKIRERMKGNKHGFGNRWKMSEEIKRKISNSRMGQQVGEKNPHWKGGISNKELMAGRPKPEQCEICGAFGKIVFDHNHKTGKFRGWICYRCNTALGLVRDSKNILDMLIDYLDENK